jgi:molybdate transport system substrate-binding protein
VRAVDVRAALAYVERKETELGIVFATDVFGNRNVKVLLEIPAELHTPAHYYCAPLRQGQREAALAWLQFMRAPEQATVMSAVGFLMPGK